MFASDGEDSEDESIEDPLRDLYPGGKFLCRSERNPVILLCHQPFRQQTLVNVEDCTPVGEWTCIQLEQDLLCLLPLEMKLSIPQTNCPIEEVLRSPSPIEMSRGRVAPHLSEEKMFHECLGTCVATCQFLFLRHFMVQICHLFFDSWWSRQQWWQWKWGTNKRGEWKGVRYGCEWSHDRPLGENDNERGSQGKKKETQNPGNLFSFHTLTRLVTGW